MEAFSPSLMTGFVFGLAMWRTSKDLWFGFRAGAAALAITVLGPVILLVFFRTPEVFPWLVVVANAGFWMWAFWEMGRPRKA